MIIKLYRGLMDIIVSQNLELEVKLTEHIRPFHEPRELEPGESGLFNGYWNFLLEICMILFAKFIFITGIFLITSLAIIFFPLDFILRVASFGGRDGRLPIDYQDRYPVMGTEITEPQKHETEEKGKNSGTK